ncbi:MAG: hypothetical protein AB7V04_06630 [Desulfomonilaceae bacterium]
MVPHDDPDAKDAVAWHERGFDEFHPQLECSTLVAEVEGFIIRNNLNLLSRFVFHGCPSIIDSIAAATRLGLAALRHEFGSQAAKRLPAEDDVIGVFDGDKNPEDAVAGNLRVLDEVHGNFHHSLLVPEVESLGVRNCPDSLVRVTDHALFRHVRPRCEFFADIPLSVIVHHRNQRPYDLQAPGAPKPS